MSSCVTYKVERIPYGSDQTFREIIDSKSVILISDLVICDSKDSVIVSEGQPKIIKDFKIVDGVISGVIVEIPEYDSSEYLISTPIRFPLWRINRSSSDPAWVAQK